MNPAPANDIATIRCQGQTEAVKANLSRKGRRLFERQRSVNAEALILTTGAAGDRTATDTLKVKRKR